MPKIIVNGNVYTAPIGSCLYSWTQQAGLTFPCGGHGICGKCRVVVDGDVSPITDTERRLLSDAAIRKGVRLACLTYVAGDCTVQLESADNPRICTDGEAALKAATPRFTCYGVAVDIGTTTLAGRLYNRQGVCLAQAGVVNPQVRFGADVLTRAEAAINDSDALADAVRSGIRSLVEELTSSIGIQASEVDGLVITGNTIMLCLLTDTSVANCVRAPFRSDCLFGEEIPTSACGLADVVCAKTVYIPRCADTFLGADLICAVLAVGLCVMPRTAILADIGTNGEMALWHNERLYLCSTAAGPAFEGVGISCGMTASDGAIDKVQILNGNLFPHIIGNGKAVGVCGTGLIDAAACLLNLGEMEHNGNMAEDYPLAEAVSLSQGDVRALQVSKSAICSGIETLLHVAGIGASDVDAFYVAGGFGTALNTVNAERIGLYPRPLSSRLKSVGNAALDGAACYLLNADTDGVLDPPLRDAIRVDLATDTFFADAFLRNMNF